MNVLRFELKNSVKSVIILSMSILAIYILFMAGVYPIFSESVSEAQKVFANFPPEFTAAFGIDLTYFFTYEGYYGFTYNYIALLAGIMAVSISLATFSREKRSKCMDFIFSKPINRKKVFLFKLLSNIIMIVLTNIVFILMGMIVYGVNDVKDTNSDTFFIALLGVFFTQIVFLCIGIFIAVFLKKIRSVSGMSTAVGFGAFILSALVNIIQEDYLKFLAPLKYFDPYPLFKEGSYNMKYVIFAFIFSAVCLVFSYTHYCKSDTPL